MQPSTIIALAMSITAAIAVPHMDHKKADNLCHQNQAEACCDSPSDIAVAGSLCSLLSIATGTCSGSVQCCDVNQNGDINLINLCVPIALP